MTGAAYSGPPAPRYIPGEGPKPSPLVLLGEAPGQNEEIYRRPFVGAAGQELNRILNDAGFNRESLYVTNVFKTRPANNDVAEFFTKRTDPAACLDLPPLRPGLFLRAKFRSALDELTTELEHVGAKVVVALGATALWALLGYQKISSYVGTVHPPTSTRAWTVIPTYHPAAVIRQWSLRTTVVANLIKAHDALAVQPTRVVRPAPLQSLVKVNPNLAEIRAFVRRAVSAPAIAVDVETAEGQIRTIAFAISPSYAFTIPFWEPPASSYWDTDNAELAAWNAVREILASPATKIFHNGAYDIQYLWRVHGIPVLGPIEDTMLLHHALEPELPKSLGFLAATYTDLPEWKTMRRRIDDKDEE